MPCTEYGNATICTTGVQMIRRRIIACPVCKRRRRMVLVFPESPYYAATLTCLGCGDSWSEGERMERPFQRGWRERAKAEARDKWAHAFQQTPQEYDEWKRRWFE